MMAMRTTARFISSRFLSGARNMSQKAKATAENFRSDAKSHNIHEEMQQLSRRVDKVEKAIPNGSTCDGYLRNFVAGYVVMGLCETIFMKADGSPRLSWKAKKEAATW